MKKTILVVDDEFEVALAVQSILEDEGYEILSAGDGREAKEKLESKLPDLIISDVMMPFCGGLELLEFIKTHETYRNIPVILMSAAPIKTTGFEPEGLLKKPFNLENLLSIVENMLC